VGTLAKLEAGTLSVRASRPPWLDLSQDTEEMATFRDRRTGIAHLWSWFEGLPLELDPKHLAQHARDAAHHARWLFERAWEQPRAARDPALEPRTRDPHWSPLISLDLVRVEGGTAALVLHRMAYEPSYETVMGHLLVPSRDGLFEWRWFAATDRPAWRESDSPTHDAATPGHVLSLARSTALDLLAQPAVSVLSPQPPSPAAPVLLPATRCTVSLPPRFRPHGTSQSEGTISDQLVRVSLAGTDGLDRLLLQRTPSPLPPETSLPTWAHTESTNLYQRAQAHHIEVTPLPPLAPGHATLLVEARGHQGPLRGVLDWWLDDQRRPWSAQLVTTAALPVAEMTEDLREIATSWRA
jgi:hypothetical protein